MELNNLVNTKKVLNGLKLFLKDYPIAKAFFVYGGERGLYVNDICVMPYKGMHKKSKHDIYSLRTL